MAAHQSHPCPHWQPSTHLSCSSHLPAPLPGSAGGHRDAAAAQTPSGWTPEMGESSRPHWEHRHSTGLRLWRLPGSVHTQTKPHRQDDRHTFTLGTCPHWTCPCHVPPELWDAWWEQIPVLGDTVKRAAWVTQLTLPCKAGTWPYWLLLGFCFGGSSFLNLPRKVSQSGKNPKIWHTSSINPTMPAHRSECTQMPLSPAQSGASECCSCGSSSVLTGPVQLLRLLRTVLGTPYEEENNSQIFHLTWQRGARPRKGVEEAALDLLSRIIYR